MLCSSLVWIWLLGAGHDFMEGIAAQRLQGAILTAPQRMQRLLCFPETGSGPQFSLENLDLILSSPSKLRRQICLSLVTAMIAQRPVPCIVRKGYFIVSIHSILLTSLPSSTDVSNNTLHILLDDMSPQMFVLSILQVGARTSRRPRPREGAV